MATTTLRKVAQVVRGSKQMEGAGVQICRTVGTPALRNLDPYLVRRRRAHVVQVTLHNTACTPGWQDASMLPSCRAYVCVHSGAPAK